jgi:hypothetical protein
MQVALLAPGGEPFLYTPPMLLYSLSVVSSIKMNLSFSRRSTKLSSGPILTISQYEWWTQSILPFVCSHNRILRTWKDKRFKIYRRQHVIVQDQFKPKLAFDEEGLKTLADLKKPVTLQGE